jgi:hypothetical protein
VKKVDYGDCGAFIEGRLYDDALQVFFHRLAINVNTVYLRSLTAEATDNQEGQDDPFHSLKIKNMAIWLQ